MPENIINVRITMMAIANADFALLKKTDLFSDLPQENFDFIISRSWIFDLPKGENLFSPGKKAEHLYILKSGAIRVFITRSNGSENEMAMFTAGDTIGDFDFARGAEYDAFAAAAEDSQLIMFPSPGHTMDSLAQEEPNIVCNIFLNAIVMITGRIKSTHKLISQDMSWVQELHRRAYEDASTGLWKQSLIADEIIGNLKDPTALIMLKPDRFKILVDSRGHSAGDEAMVRIALIMKNIVRNTGNGWALRFKSNEVGFIFCDCNAVKAEKIAKELAQAIAAMEPVPAQDDIPAFHFSSTISWAIWPHDAQNPQSKDCSSDWEIFFQGNYASLLENWRNGGERIVRYNKAGES